MIRILCCSETLGSNYSATCIISHRNTNHSYNDAKTPNLGKPKYSWKKRNSDVNSGFCHGVTEIFVPLCNIQEE
jgi:hypothetical protein